MKILCADLFCGGGGTSTGMVSAFEKNGIEYELVGVNHWDRAIETNNLNHKGKYYKDSVERVSPRELVPSGRLHILWASPECTNHSRAKGGRPKDEQSRATAWDVLKWPQELYIDRIYIENVEEFLEWGPCDEEGKPIEAKKGAVFRQYIRMLKSLGYRVDWQIMNAADFGAPTCRRRLIIQAVRGKHKIFWPQPTHAREPGLFGEQRWVAAREIIDWDLRGTSIFERERPLAANTLRRIYSGIAKHGGRYADRFGFILRREIVRSCKSSNKCPFGVLAALPVIMPGQSRHEPFITVMRGTAPAQDGPSVKSIDGPLLTISTNGHEGLVSFVTRYNGGDNRNHAISNPVPVVDCSNRYALVEPFVFAIGQTSAGSRSTKISMPLSTIVTKAEHCIVEPMIAARRFENVPRSVDMPCPTIVTTGNLDLCEPMCISLRGTDRWHIESAAKSVSETIGTITTSGKHHYVCEPSLIDMSHPAEISAARIRSAQEQLPTITTRNNLALVEPLFIPQHGGGTVKPVSNPLPTIATTGSISVVCPMLVKFYGGEEKSHSTEKPLDTVTCRDRFGLADGRLIVDETGRFLLLDILFRMLQPHELAMAMSFPRDYRFAGTKSDQVKQIGNAVCPALAEALIESALDDMRRIGVVKEKRKLAA